ncbi:hypothetical protein K3495_g12501 [Podosphaera aphanis]|nr:hypothetical protein K3495_g12501 [Podosphaera aphanis]
MATALALIQARVAQYAPNDQYNCDETGLFWKLIPDRSLATMQLAGVKKEKARITIHHCCNATGTHKLPIWIIARHKRPRCFAAAGVRDPEVLGIKWRTNKKAWMITGIMMEWLLWFDRQMVGRKVILLLDNFSAHEAAVNELAALPLGFGLLNTEICWLPPNTTSRLQPLDQGIIASFKAHYRRQWITYMLEQHEIGYDALRTMNVLKAIRFSVGAWSEVTPITIANCWRHSTVNLQPQETTVDVEIEAVSELQVELQELHRQQRIQQLMDVNYLLHLPEELVEDSADDVHGRLVQLYSPVEDQESEEERVEELPRVQPRQALLLLQQLRLYEEQK